MDLGREVDRLHRHVSQAGLNDTPLRSFVVDPLRDTLRRAKKRLEGKSHKRREPLFFMLWLVWLFVGTMFYAYASKSNLGIVRGFYMAINIGYSIGFGYPSEEGQGNYLYFSSIYVLLGASFVGVALGFFAEKITKDSETWFTKLQHEKEIEEAIRSKGTTLQGNLQAWIYHNSSALRAVSTWLFIIIVMIVYSMIAVGWPFGEAQYFAVSTLSTGGHWPIPAESPDWLFGLTAILTMVGVPVMAVAMAEIAQVLISKSDLDEAKETIAAVVTKEELEFLEELGLEDFNGKVDKAEFIILCMVRMGTDPGMIKYITQRFAELNFYTGQALTVAEITQGACKFVKGKIRRAESVQGMGKLKVVSEHDYVVPEASKSYLDYYHNKMDDSASSHGSDIEYSRRNTVGRRKTPLLAAVPEDLTHSQHVRQIQEGRMNGTNGVRPSIMEMPKLPELDISKQSQMDSSNMSAYHRTRSLELYEVFNTSGLEPGSSSFAAQNSSGIRIPRKERRDTSRPSIGYNQSKGEVPRKERRDTSRPSMGYNRSQGGVVIPTRPNATNETKEPDDIDSSIESSGYTFATSSRRRLSTTINESESGDQVRLADLAEESINDDLTDTEEGRLWDGEPTPTQQEDVVAGAAKNTVSENDNPGTNSDAFLDEMEEGRLENENQSRLRRFYDDLKEECASVQTDSDSNHDGNKDYELTRPKLNYANFLFSRENGSRELKARQPDTDLSRGQPSRSLQLRRSTKLGEDPMQNGYHHTQFTSEGNSSSDSSTDTADLLPRLPRRSFSSYLFRGS